MADYNIRYYVDCNDVCLEIPDLGSFYCRDSYYRGQTNLDKVEKFCRDILRKQLDDINPGITFEDCGVLPTWLENPRFTIDLPPIKEVVRNE